MKNFFAASYFSYFYFFGFCAINVKVLSAANNCSPALV